MTTPTLTTRGATADPSSRSSRDPLDLVTALLVAVGVLLRIALVFLLPLGERSAHHLQGLNDEPAHVAYVRYVATHAAFPVLRHWGSDPEAYRRNDFEYHQAPLYYVACAPAFAALGERRGLIACRLLAALAGLLCIPVAMGLMRDARAPAPVPEAAGLFVALYFPAVYTSALASNDGWATLFGLLVTRVLVRLSTAGEIAGISGGRVVRSGLTLAAALLVKSSLLIFVPILAAIAVWHARSARRPRALEASLTLALGCALAAPWYLRNLTLYHSLLGMPVGSIGMSGTDAIGVLRGTARSFWYPMRNLPEGSALRQGVTAVGGILIALHVALAAWWLTRREARNAATGVMLAALALGGLGYVWYLAEWRNTEARLLLPMTGSIAFLMLMPARAALAHAARPRLLLAYVAVLSALPYAVVPLTG